MSIGRKTEREREGEGEGEGERETAWWSDLVDCSAEAEGRACQQRTSPSLCRTTRDFSSR